MSDVAPQGEAVSIPGTILVVEDETMVRIVIADELRDAGLNVLEAANADEALAVLAAHPIDLILTDLKMPGSMNGFDLADAVRDRFPGVKIALMTGMMPDKDERPTFDVLLRKPFDISMAAWTFKKMLNGER